MTGTGKYDVLIIGGGVIGLSIARQLKKRGIARIAVADRGEVGREASYAAAGMLVPRAEADSPDEFYRFCAASCGLYEEFAAELFDETGVDIELDREGTLYLAFDDKASSEIDRRFAWQSEAGTGVERISAAEILELEPLISPSVREGLFFPGDWQVENRKLLNALRRYADLNGIELLENCEIETVTFESGRASGAAGSRVKLLADNIVLATGAWSSLINIGSNRLPVDVRPIKGQIICFRTGTRLLRRIIFGPNGYLVPRSNGRVLAGATVEDAGFAKNLTVDAVESLRNAAREMAPAFGSMQIAESWAGLRPAAADGLPVLGGIEGVLGVHVATAHFRNGILLAPITAEIIADSICSGEVSGYVRSFGVQRFASATATVRG